MRITGGEAKGRPLRATRSAQMRPTTDTTRRTVFDILGDVVVDARVLDLFAGAGTLGIEALSRGARTATFVERDRAACDVIARNLKDTGMGERGVVRRAEVRRFLAGVPDTPFDLAFLDPPYEAGLPFVGLVLERVIAGSWVCLGGTVVVEAAEGQIQWPSGFREIRTRRFGRTRVSVARRDDGRANGYLSGDV